LAAALSRPSWRRPIDQEEDKVILAARRL